MHDNANFSSILENAGPHVKRPAANRSALAYLVGSGHEIGVPGHQCETARALALAEEHIAAHRANVVVIDLATREFVPLNSLREHAEEEAEDNEAPEGWSTSQSAGGRCKVPLKKERGS